MLIRAPLMHSTHPQKVKLVFSLHFHLALSEPTFLLTFGDDQPCYLYCVYFKIISRLWLSLGKPGQSQDVNIWAALFWMREMFSLLSVPTSYEGLLLAVVPVPWHIWWDLLCVVTVWWRVECSALCLKTECSVLCFWNGYWHQLLHGSWILVTITKDYYCLLRWRQHCYNIL